MIKVATLVLEAGICSLQSIFKQVFPLVTYHTLNAKRKLLQMPMVAIQVQCPSTNRPEILVTELIEGIDYFKVLHFLNAFATARKTSSPSLSKNELNQLLLLAQSDRERELVKFTAFRASGLSKSSARRHFGFENLSERMAKVEESIKEAEILRQCIESLSQVQEKAFMQSLGYTPSDDSSDENSCEDETNPIEDTVHDDRAVITVQLPPETEFLELLQMCMFNWFEMVNRITERNPDAEEKDVIAKLDDFFSVAMNSDLRDNCKALLEQSYQAFKCDCTRRLLIDREANALNGQIVTDSESEDPDQYLNLHDILSERAKSLITAKRKQLRRRTRYLRSKQMAERNFLSRKVTHRVSGILKECPNIGNEIEKFVQDSSVGADAWRRTGILTFDGNTRVKRKVTYERIRQHLMEVYKRNFSFGTVVQLCVARNKRRLSAKRYRSVAKVTSRRARKGFMLKYNPDEHWSCAFYRNLNLIQYTDGRHITNINRDDAAGFRLDTMATHRLQRTPMVQGSEATTTYTDYVNKYKSILQTTSYNFSRTETTLEFCAGVVKPVGLFPKNPTQHSWDLEMLGNAPELQAAFINPLTGKNKIIECIRVDGAADEGPSHEEVQFAWSARHLSKATIATLVTARNSGSSYLNRVELQNGCLALGHANLFIPSTLGGSCMDSGQVNKEKYKENMNLATDVYLNRVNDCPCGDTVIHLYRGTDSTEQQQNRKYVLQYLKGSKAQKEELKSSKPALYAYIDQVWQVRNNHMVKDLPLQYAFFLVCCFQANCSHPLCSQGLELPKWFDSGPSISHLPLPIPDPIRCYGNPNCKECKGFCCGHFLKPDETLTSSQSPMNRPPSVVLKEAFDSLPNYPPSESKYSELSKKVMLPVDDVKIWLDHLMTVRENRKKGAIKAAETRRKKKNTSAETTRESEYQCGVCHGPFQEFTDTEEKWIGCETCDSWFHFVCLGISAVPDVFICSNCES